MGSIYPEGTFILNGLSMDRSAGGYRIGTCIMPEGCSQKTISEFKKILATIYTAAATPMQQAAVSAYLSNPSMDTYLHDTREIHRIMTTRLATLFNSIEGVNATIPESGFSFLVDLNSIAHTIQAAGIQYSNDIAPAMIQHPYHMATVTGEAMMAAYNDFFIRISVTDYDGAAALTAFRADPPKNDIDEEAFFIKFGSRMIAGMEMFQIWIQDIQKGTFKYNKEI